MLISAGESVPRSDPETLELVGRCRQGETEAERLLFHRFVARLVDLLNARIPAGLARRFGPEDGAQEVFASLFRAVREDRIALVRSGDLWAWLARIAHHKLVNLVKRELRLKRSLMVEEAGSISGVLEDDARYALASGEPGVHEAVALADELEYLFGPVGATLRQVVDLRLREMSHFEIARRLEVSHTTVGRHLRRIAAILAARLQELEEDAEMGRS